MRKNDRFEQELNVVGAARRAKAFGIKTMTVVVTVAMLVSGVPTRVIAEGLQEAGVIAAQDSTDQSASSSGQQETAQSNTQEQPQAASEQAAQPSSQDNAAAAQNDSPSAQPAPSAQPSQQTATADIALTLNNASITYKGQVVAQPAQKVTAPTSDSFEFTVQPDNGYKLSKVTLTVSGTDRELKADANGLYTVGAADVAQSPRVTLETEQEKAAEPAKEATPIEDAEGVSDDNAAADQAEDKKSDEKDANTVDVASMADAKAAKLYTVEVGGTVTINEATPSNYNSWESSDESIATVDDNGTVTGKKASTVPVTITHGYYLGWWSWQTETFTVQVTPAGPKISGDDTVKMGESATFTVSGFEQGQTVQWKSENSNVATVDASGNVTGVHVGKTNIIAYTNNQSVSKQIEVKRDDLSGGYYVYLYTKAEGNTDGLALTVNSSGWYTIGRVWVAGIQNPAQARQNGKSQTNESFNKTIAALQNSDNIDLYAVNSINLSDINWRASGDYGITLASGANDYPEATGTQWHLDGYVKFDYFGSLIFHYKDAKTKDKIAEDYTTTAKVTDENFDFSSLKISIAGYTYDHADPELVKVEKNQTKEVTLYYNKGTFPYTVKYLEKGTGRELRTEKSGAGEYGSTVTENAKDIDGYELADDTQKQQSIQLGTGDNVITFYYKKAPASYTVNYYWNGTTEKVAKSKTVNNCYVNDEVTATPAPVDGCTPVSDDSKTLKLVKDESKNEINFYYYKNVELTAKSDEVTYNGEEHSVSGFTGAPEGADFSAIEVSASGINAGTYPANFADGTVGTVDATKKYIVTNVTDGQLAISPVTKQVTVTIKGHKGGEKYNGKEQSVTDYDVSGLPKGMTKDDIVFTGKAEAKGTNAGTYHMGLSADQFKISDDAAKNFTNVTFSVTDGELTIAKRKIYRITPDGHKNYDGAALVRKGDLNDDKCIDPEHKNDDDGFVGGEGFAGKENFTWTEDAVLPGEYDNVVKNVTYNKKTNSNNYDVKIKWGKLTIGKPSESEKHEITLTANSFDAKYDGEEHTATGFATSSLSFTTKDGVVTYTLENVETSNPTKKNAGVYKNNFTDKDSVKVIDEKGRDVTNLVNLKFVDGKLAIQKRSVTLVSESKDFPYDGRNHSCEKVSVDSSSDGFVEGEGVTYKNFATIKNVGTKGNSFDFDWGTAAERNYEITKRCGTLSVTKGDISKYVTLKTVDVSETYDGEHHVAGEATATDENGNELKIEYQKSDGTWTTNRNDVYAVNVGDYGIVNVRVSSPANYGEGNYVTGTEKLVVNPVAITLTAKSASKPYDGIALTNNGYDITEGKFVGDEGLGSVTVSGSRTEVGKSDNEITAYALKKNTKSTNYKIELVKGHLEVIASNAAVVVKIKGNTDSKKYSGNEQSVSGYTVTGVTVDGKDSKLYGAEAGTDFTFNGNATAAGTDAGKTDMGLAADQFSNNNGNFSNVTFEVEDGSITINKREVTLTSASDKKPYDGTPLTKDVVTVSGDGFVSGQGFTANVTGSQTNAGSSDNAFTYKLTGGATEGENGNYTITTVPGKLIVEAITAPVTVTIVGNTATGTYNGQELKAEGYTFTSDKKLYTKDMVAFSGTAEAARTNAGKTEMGLIDKFANKDTTNFKNVTFNVTDGYVDIAKAPVTLTSANLFKQYDGTALVNGETALETESGFAAGEGAIYTFTGSQTVVGSSPNAFGYTLNSNTNIDNYDITKTEGALTVTNRDAKYKITVKAKSNTATYNGETHSAEGLEQTEFTFDGNTYTVSGLSTENPTETNAGTYTNNIFGTAVVKDAKGNDVTNQFAVATENGTLTINKATVTIKSASDEWTYNGTERTKHEMKSVEGFAKGEGATFNYTGAITNAGEVKNEFNYKLNDGTSADNYSIKTEYGTLKVKPVSDKVTVTITGNKDARPYSGAEQSVTGYEFDASNTLYTKNDVKFTGDATARGTAAGTYKMGLTKQKFSNISKNFTNVEFVVNDGSLKITGGEIDQSGVTWTLNNLQKKYDGNTYKAGTATAKDKFGNGLKVEYSVDGKNWTVDSSTITAKNYSDSKLIQLRATGDNYKDGEYAYSPEREQLIIGKRLLTMTSAGDSKKYDGTPLVKNSQSDVAVTGDGFAKGEGAKYDITGSQTEAGSSRNEFTYSLNDGTLEENYQITRVPGTLTVTANDSEVVVTIEGNSATKTYNGQPQSVEGYKVVSISNDKYTSSDFELEGTAKAERSVEGTTYMGLSANNFVNKSANFSKVTFQVTDGYITIKPKSIVPDPKDPDNNMSVKEPDDAVYNGQVQQQKPVVKDGDRMLVEGTDYMLSYSKDATNVGTVTVTVTGMGNYSGEAKVSYQITPAPLSITTDSGTKIYDGTPLTAPGSIEGLVAGETAGFKITGSQTQVGVSKNTYELKWNGSAKESNYEIKKKSIGTLTVTSQSINPENPDSYKGVTVGDLKNIKYNGRDRKQEPIVKSNGVGLVKGRDYELSYSDDTINAGEVTVTVKGVGNYSGAVRRTYRITKRKVKLSSNSRSKVYDGSALTDSAVVETGEDTFVSGEVSNIRATGSITNPGTVENAITFDRGEKFNEHNYTIEYVTGKLTVKAKDVAAKDVKVQAPSDTVYSGKEQKLEPVVTDGSKKLVKDVDYDLSYSDDVVNAGTVTITVAGKGNYGGTAGVQYKIKARPVTLVSNGHMRSYNGSPLEDDAVVVTSEYNFVDGEVSDLKADGSITEPGEVVNNITYTKNAAYKDSNYKVTITEGKLKVLPCNLLSSGMEISNLVDVVYNGQVQKQKPVVKDGDKTLVEGTDYTLSYSEDATNVGKVTVTVTGKGNYTGTVERTYNITRAPLTVVTESATHVYNGHELTAPGKLEGLVAGETADFKTTGKQKSVGSSVNTYDINWNGTAKSGNYRIAAEKLGTLTVTESKQTIVVATTGGRFEYDGLTHVPTVNVYNLPEGYSVRDASSNAAVKDVNARKDSDQGIAVTADNLVILNAEGEDVTSKLTIEKADGYLAVTPRTVTVNTPSDSKVYDGTALTAPGKLEGLVAGETVDFKTTGSQTEVGNSTNTYELTWNGSAKESNYTVKETLGKLEVSRQSIDEKDEKDYKGIKIDDPASTIYDGSKHQWTPTVTDAAGNKLTVDKDYEVAYKRDGVVSDDFKNVGTITVVISGKGNYAGTVTKKYEITKRAVTLTSADHTWTYDGKDHQDERVNVTGDGFATGEGVDYSNFATVKDVTTKPVENTFTYTAKKGTDLEKNYNVKVVNGKLTVTKAAAAGNIVLTTKDESKTYDGHALEAGEAKATVTTGDDVKVEYSADHKAWTENRSDVTLTNAGSKTVYVRASSEKNFSGYVEATETLTVDPATLTIVTKSAEKPFDGEALTADGSITGLVNGETAEFKVTGTLTAVGEIANAYTLTWNGTAQKSNYIVKETVGKLKVTARSIDDTTYGMSVSDPKDVEYDGSAHKWTPTVKDGEKKLVEGTDYTVAYSKDDFTNVTGVITVTITGKGNYTGSVERVYQINPAPLTVKTEGASKVYDGEALTHDVAAIKGLKNKETATIHATGSQIEVGESDNGYAITWDGSAQKDNYTIKTKTIGKLVVSETADQITATPANVETTYDGNMHGTTVQVTGLPKGYTVKKAESKATATNVADGEVKATVDELVIVNAQGKDVASKLNIKRGTATIKINPAPLTVTTDGGEKEYDGTALTVSGIKVEGLKGKDSVSAKTTGSRTKVGSSDNTYEINWKDIKKSNYKVTDVLGTLKVTPSTKAVTLTSGSASHAYSGHALTSDEIKAEGLPEGFTVKAKMDGAQTDAGSSENTVKSYKILDAKGDDVTDMFANVTVKTGTLTVSPKKITVETEGATKVYDGEELTNKNGAIHGLVSGEHADVVTNGTQTNVGSSDNGYTIAWGTAKEGNYTIASDTLGKLIVTPQSVNPNDPSYHKLQVSNPADLTYDGQTHKWAPEVKDFTGAELKEGVDYTLAYDTDDFINAGVITVTVVGKGNYTGTVSRTYRIKPAPVSIKTESAARAYNGKALTAGGAITGLVNGETVDFRVTGSQTKVGHSANTYKLAWTGTAREANYTVDSVETGTLTVTESEDTVVVTTTGGTFTYDGEAHGATVAVSQLPEGYTVDGTPSSDTTATDANGDGVKATVDHLVIRNAEGEDVTSKLNIKKVDGTIKVLPAELTVATDSATKVYDGTALTAGATVTGLVGDEEATLEATGKQTKVGSSSNGYKLTFDKTAKAKNYKVVSENLGTLTVTKQSIVPSEPGTPSDNYKGVTVDDPKDAVYDGVEHKWTPVVKDAEGKTLVEGTDYVVSYDTDDLIDVATINVTITGKGNYTGTIAKSYRITKAPLHVVTGSATKVYDGTALTSATVTIDGLAERDRIGIAVTGSQTNVGSSQNTYTIDWMQTSADNYELTDELGTLTVAAAPARPTTPTTPVTPATPATPITPTVPNPTPNGSDGGSTATTTAPKSDGSSDSNDQEQKEEKVFDAKNPLGKFDGKKDTCWVHWYMIICAVATAAYGLFVGLRRDKHSRRLQNDLDEVLGNDDETQE